MTRAEATVQAHDYWQTHMHPFTCRTDDCDGELVAHPHGPREVVMICPKCDRDQPLTGHLRQLVDGFHAQSEETL